MAYLVGHGLVSAYDFAAHGYDTNFVQIKLTAIGVDFLEDDGGLRSILGVITVKIHEDSLRQILESRVAISGLDEESKTRVVNRLRQIGAAGMKKLADRLLSLGADKAVETGGEAVESILDSLGL